jgi:pyrimidine operon attenuation protein/uracil phosphoribosyltransferase
MIQLDAEAIYRSLLAHARERYAGRDIRLVGIHTGGVWLAERLRSDIKVEAPIGQLDPSFYRDDFDTTGLHANVRPSSIGFEVAGAHIVLVDDVLYTGRTIRAAMNELFDHGRPAAIDLAVLVDRGGRELPVAASLVGSTIEVPAGVSVVLARGDDGRLSLTLESGDA